MDNHDKIRRSHDNLISMMTIPIPGKIDFILQQTPFYCNHVSQSLIQYQRTFGILTLPMTTELSLGEASTRCNTTGPYVNLVLICQEIHTRSPFFTRDQLWPSGIVIACVCLSLCVCMCVSVNHQFVRTITCHPLKLQSPKLDQKCKTPWLGSLLFFGFIDLDLQGQIELKCQNLPHFGLVSLSGL